MAEIPGVKPPQWYENQWVGEFLALISPTIATGITAWLYFNDKTKPPLLFWLMVVSIAALVGTGVVKILRARVMDKDQRRQRNPDGLKGGAYIIHSLVKRMQNFDDTQTGRLRITIHRVIAASKPGDGPEQLEQVIPYVGGPGGDAGRKFPIRSGIIGLAVRDKTPYAALREKDDYTEFIKELVQKWSYTEQDAKRLTQDRKSWMAVPILDQKSEVIGVVFCDSNQHDFFTEEVQDTIIAACSGIAAYIDERYDK